MVCVTKRGRFSRRQAVCFLLLCPSIFHIKPYRSLRLLSTSHARWSRNFSSTPLSSSRISRRLASAESATQPRFPSYLYPPYSSVVHTAVGFATTLTPNSNSASAPTPRPASSRQGSATTPILHKTILFIRSSPCCSRAKCAHATITAEEVG